MTFISSATLILIIQVLGFITWGFPLLILTVLAYSIEYYTKFRAKWRIFLIATILALTYPIEHAHDYWDVSRQITSHQLIVNSILLLSLVIAGYGSFHLLKFQKINIGKTQSAIEALMIISIIGPATTYLSGILTLSMLWLLISYNLSISILVFIFLTIGKLSQKYMPRDQLVAYTFARIGAILLLIDPILMNLAVFFYSNSLTIQLVKVVGLFSQTIASILLIFTIYLLIREARERGPHILPSSEGPVEAGPKKYRLKNGYSYLVTEYSSEKSFDIFHDYITHDHFGLVITRTAPDRVRTDYDLRTTPILWMTKADTDEKTIRPHNLDRLMFIIKDFIYSQDNCITLLQRLDYLITENGFTETLRFINELNDVVIPTKSILLVSADPTTLTGEQLALIRKELEDLSYSQTIVLNEPLYNLLQYVYGENKRKKMPSFTNITREFNITKTTARKRIYELENKGLIRVIEQGKFKLLEVTQRGRGVIKSPVGPVGEE
ncbi:DUF835 domain-containing protein [Candidatus Altiarchaeota archaeon]